MRRVIFLMWSCLGIAILIPALGFLSIGYWYLGLISLIWLILWVWGYLSRSRWAIAISLIGICLELVMREWLDLSTGWTVVGMILALVAWDMQWFAWRMSTAVEIYNERKFVLAHVLRVTIVAIFGLVLAGIALSLRITFGFGVAILLGFLVVLGLRQWILIAKRSVA